MPRLQKAMKSQISSCGADVSMSRALERSNGLRKWKEKSPTQGILCCPGSWLSREHLGTRSCVCHQRPRCPSRHSCHCSHVQPVLIETNGGALGLCCSWKQARPQQTLSLSGCLCRSSWECTGACRQGCRQGCLQCWPLYHVQGVRAGMEMLKSQRGYTPAGDSQLTLSLPPHYLQFPLLCL